MGVAADRMCTILQIWHNTSLHLYVHFISADLAIFKTRNFNRFFLFTKEINYQSQISEDSAIEIHFFCISQSFILYLKASTPNSYTHQFRLTSSTLSQFRRLSTLSSKSHIFHPTHRHGRHGVAEGTVFPICNTMNLKNNLIWNFIDVS